MIKLLLADDHTLFREGLKRILSGESDIVVVDEASSGNEVLDLVSRNEPDVVILDISMPGRHGLEILTQLKSLQPELNVLVLSMYSEAQYAFRALKAGASGYLTKSSASQELITAIRKVSLGRKYISAAVAEQVAAELATSESDQSPHSKLSNREYQVMLAISSGKTVSQIAKELSLSVSTISTLRTRILNKLGLRTNAQIIHYAVKNDLTE